MPLYPTPEQETSLRRQVVAAGACLVVAVLALNLPPAPRESIAGGIRATAMRPFVEIHEAWVTIQERALDAETLRAQNDQLIAIGRMLSHC